MCARAQFDVIVISPEGLSAVDTSQKLLARRFGLSWPSPAEVDVPQLSSLHETFQRIEPTCDGPIVIVGMVFSGCVQWHDGQWRIMPILAKSKSAENVEGFIVPPTADLIFSQPRAQISVQQWIAALSLYLPTTCSQQVADYYRLRQYSSPN